MRCTSMILHFVFPSLRGLAEIPIHASPSLAVLLFALSISLIVGVAFGIAPAWMATRVDPTEACAARAVPPRAPALHRARRLSWSRPRCRLSCLCCQDCSRLRCTGWRLRISDSIRIAG